MGPNEDNPKGFFENTKITTINDIIMDRLGFSWDDPFSVNIDWQKLKFLPTYQEQLAKIIDTEFNNSNLIGFKDPRASLLLPWWQQALPEYEFIPLYLISYRHPLEVAASLNKRNNFSTAKSVLLWMKYLLAAERYTRHHQRFFVFFDKLLVNPLETLNNLINELKINFPFSIESRINIIEKFLEKPLKHHNLTATKDNDNNCLSLALDYYLLLQQFNKINECNYDEVYNNIDQLYSQYENLHHWFCPKELHVTGLIAKELQTKTHIIHFYYAQLFIDTGIGFNESQSIVIPIHGQEQIIEFDLAGYDNIKNLRFDPINEITILHLKSIYIVTNDDEIIQIDNYYTNAFNQKDLVFIFDNIDPQIIFTAIKQPKKIIINLQHIAISNLAYPHIVQYKNTEINSKNAEIKDHINHIYNRNIEIQKYIKLLQNKDSEIQEYIEKIRIKDNELQTYNQFIDNKESEISFYNENIRAKNNEINECKQQLKNKDSEIIEYIKFIDAKNILIQEYNQIIDAKNSELAYYYQLFSSNNYENPNNKNFRIIINKLKNIQQSFENFLSSFFGCKLQLTSHILCK